MPTPYDDYEEEPLVVPDEDDPSGAFNYDDDVLLPQQAQQAPTIDSVIGESPVEKQFRALYENLTGDPYRQVQNAARAFGERFVAMESDGRLTSAATETFQRLGERFSQATTTRRSVEPYTTPDSMLATSRSSIFFDRPTLTYYNEIFGEKGRIASTFFQLQQEDVLRRIMSRYDETRLGFQRLDVGTGGDREERLTKEGAQRTAGILAGNELTLAAIEAHNKAVERGEKVGGVISAVAPYHPSSMHIKAGYTKTRAFVSTQNITPALTNNNTVETLLQFRYDSDNAAERALALQVQALTNATLGMEEEAVMRQQANQPTGDAFAKLNARVKREMTNELAVELDSHLQTDRNVFVNEQIITHYIKTLETVSIDSTTHAVLSMGELSLLLGGGGFQAEYLRRLVYDLGENNRLTIITDSTRLDNILQDIKNLDMQLLAAKVAEKVSSQPDHKGNVTLDRLELRSIDSTWANRFVELVERGNVIRRGATGSYYHDKSLAIFSQTGSLLSLTVGSANLTEAGVAPLWSLSALSRQGTLQALGFSEEQVRQQADLLKQFELPRSDMSDMSLRQLQDYTHQVSNAIQGSSLDEALKRVLLSTTNTEAVVAFGRGDFHVGPESLRDEFGSLLDSMSETVLKSYKTRAGLRFTEDWLQESLPALRAERRVFQQGEKGSQRVQNLFDRLQHISQELDGAVEVRGRYHRNRLVGVEVTIAPLDVMSSVQSTQLTMTVNEQGNVIVLGYDKVISGSVVVNNTKVTQRLRRGDGTVRALQVGQSEILSGIDTAVAVVGTVARAVSYHSRFGLTERAMDYVTRNRSEGRRLAQQILADAIQMADGRFTLDRRFNLQSVLNLAMSSNDEVQSYLRNLALQNTDATERARLLAQAEVLGQARPVNFQETLQRARSLLAEGALGDNSVRRLVNLDANGMVGRREQALAGVFTALNQLQNLGSDSLNSAADILLDLLISDQFTQSSLFTDLRFDLTKELVGSGWAARQAQADSKAILRAQLAPFLTTGENTYPFQQLQMRRPVYGFRTGGRSVGEAFDQYGFLDPLGVRHSTNLGQSFVRLTSMTTTPARISLGGLLSVTASPYDEPYEGAVAVYDMEIFDSTSNLGRRSWGEIQQQLTVLKGRQIEVEEIQQMLSSVEPNETRQQQLLLLMLPYPAAKLDQLPQRLKNLLGGRAMLEIDPMFARNLEEAVAVGQVDPAMTTDLTRNIISGLPLSLADKQYAQVEALVRELKDKGVTDPTAIRAAVEQQLREQAVLDPSLTQILAPTMKRVAIAGGISTISGDFALRNEAYQTSVGYVSTTRISFSARSSVSVAEMQRHLQSIFQQGRTIVDHRGLFVLDDEGQMRHVASFTHQGTLQLIPQEIASTEGMVLGIHDIKLPTFGLKERHGISVAVEVGSFEERFGRYTLEVTWLHQSREMDGMRPGYGPIKGPFQFLRGGLFDRVSQQLSQQAPAGSDLLYAIYSPSLLKGFTYESGIYLFTDRQQRETLEGMTAREMAASLLATLYTQDAVATRALATYFDEIGMRHRAAGLRLSLTETKQDVSTKASSLAWIAAQLGHTDQEGTTTSMAALRQRLVEIVTGERTGRSAEQLRVDILKLFHTARRTGISELGVLQDADPMVRGAASIATALSLGQQFISPGFGVAGESGAGLHGINLLDAQGYREDASIRFNISAVAAHLGVRLDTTLKERSVEEIQKTLERELGFAQKLIERVPMYQLYVPTTSSQSLVPHGSQTQSNVELQYLTRMSTLMFATMRGVSNSQAWEQVLEVQRAYSMLTSISQYSLGRGQTDLVLMFGGGEEEHNRISALARIARASEERFAQRVIEQEIGSYLQFASNLPPAHAANVLNALLPRDNVMPFDAGQELLSYLDSLEPGQVGTRTTQLVLPELIVEAEGAGIRLRVDPSLDTGNVNYRSGVLLGQDVLSQVALRFPSFDSRVLTNQVRLYQLLHEMEETGLLIKLQQAEGRGVVLNATEARMYQELEDLLQQSLLDVSSLVTTMVQQRAAGNKLEAVGRSFVATSSLFLRSQEYLAGSAMAAGRSKGVSTLLSSIIHTGYIEPDPNAIGSSLPIDGQERLAAQKRMLDRVDEFMMAAPVRRPRPGFELSDIHTEVVVGPKVRDVRFVQTLNEIEPFQESATFETWVTAQRARRGSPADLAMLLHHQMQESMEAVTARPDSGFAWLRLRETILAMQNMDWLEGEIYGQTLPSGETTGLRQRLQNWLRSKSFDPLNVEATRALIVDYYDRYFFGQQGTGRLVYLDAQGQIMTYRDAKGKIRERRPSAEDQFRYMQRPEVQAAIARQENGPVIELRNRGIFSFQGTYSQAMQSAARVVAQAGEQFSWLRQSIEESQLIRFEGTTAFVVGSGLAGRVEKFFSQFGPEMPSHLNDLLQEQREIAFELSSRGVDVIHERINQLQIANKAYLDTAFMGIHEHLRVVELLLQEDSMRQLPPEQLARAMQLGIEVERGQQYLLRVKEQGESLLEFLSLEQELASTRAIEVGATKAWARKQLALQVGASYTRGRAGLLRKALQHTPEWVDRLYLESNPWVLHTNKLTAAQRAQVEEPWFEQHIVEQRIGDRTEEVLDLNPAFYVVDNIFVDPKVTQLFRSLVKNRSLSRLRVLGDSELEQIANAQLEWSSLRQATEIARRVVGFDRGEQDVFGVLEVLHQEGLLFTGGREVNETLRTQTAALLMGRHVPARVDATLEFHPGTQTRSQMLNVLASFITSAAGDFYAYRQQQQARTPGAKNILDPNIRGFRSLVGFTKRFDGLIDVETEHLRNLLELVPELSRVVSQVRIEEIQQAYLDGGEQAVFQLARQKLMDYERSQLGMVGTRRVRYLQTQQSFEGPEENYLQRLYRTQQDLFRTRQVRQAKDMYRDRVIESETGARGLLLGVASLRALQEAFVREVEMGAQSLSIEALQPDSLQQRLQDISTFEQIVETQRRLAQVFQTGSEEAILEAQQTLIGEGGSTLERIRTLLSHVQELPLSDQETTVSRLQQLVTTLERMQQAAEGVEDVRYDEIGLYYQTQASQIAFEANEVDLEIMRLTARDSGAEFRDSGRLAGIGRFMEDKTGAPYRVEIDRQLRQAVEAEASYEQVRDYLRAKLDRGEAITGQELSWLRAVALSELSGIDVIRGDVASFQRAEKELAKGMIMPIRSGPPMSAPGLFALMMPITIEEYAQRVVEAGSLMELSTDRLETGLILPALSALYQYLGDFDGDMITAMSLNNADVGAKLAARIRQLEAGEELTEQELNEYLEATRYLQRMYQRTEQGLENLRRISGTYLGLSYEQIESLEVGQVASLIEQVRGQYPGLEDGRGVLQRYVGMIEETRQLFEMLGAQDTSLTVETLQSLTGEERRLLIETGEFDSLLSALGLETQEELLESLERSLDLARAARLEGALGNVAAELTGTDAQYRIAELAQMEVAHGTVGSLMGRVAGALVTEDTFASLQSLIGTAATDLIGSGYNALIGLQSQAMFGMAIHQILSADEHSPLALQQARQTLLDAGITLPDMGQGVAAGIDVIEQRFERLSGLLSGLNQMFRDAIKPKSGRQEEFNKIMAELRGRVELAGQNLGIDATQSQIDRARGLVLSEELASERISAVIDDETGLTAIRGVLTLTNFLRANSNEEIEQVIASDPFLKQYYERRQIEAQTGIDATTNEQLTPLQRQQAIIEANQPERAVEAYLSHSLRQAHVGFIRSRASADDRKVGGLFGPDYISNAIALYEQLGVLTPEDISWLRSFAIGRNVVREEGLDADINRRVAETQGVISAAIISEVARGKITSPEQAWALPAAILDIAQAMQLDQGLDPSGADAQAARRSYLQALGIGRMLGLEGQALEHFYNVLSQQQVTEQVGRAMLSGAISYNLAGQLVEAQRAGDSARVEHILDQLEQLRLDAMRLEQYQMTPIETMLGSPQQMVQRIEEQRAQALRTQQRQMAESVSSSSLFDILSLFAGPVFVSLLAQDDLVADDRVGLFALDVIQSLPYLTPDQLGRERMTQSRMARAMRMHDNLFLGLSQVAFQEVSFRSMNALVGNAISRIMPGQQLSVATPTYGLREGFASLAGEVLGATLSIAVSRAFGQAVVDDNWDIAEAADLISESIRYSTKYIWQMAEQYALLLLDTDYEVLNHEDGTQLDYSAQVINPIELGLITGMTVVDALNGEAVEEAADIAGVA